ncbi:hypothetical protein DTO271G3_2836 [Paecilomyces variotii]|nr:hypothetical protein DTO271G3_2836 [Paecilomyces variotii]
MGNAFSQDGLHPWQQLAFRPGAGVAKKVGTTLGESSLSPSSQTRTDSVLSSKNAGLDSASPYAGFRELRLANRRAGSRHFPIISDHRLASSGIRIITTTSPRRREAQPLIDSAVSPSIPWVLVEALPIRDLAATLCGRERCWTPDIFVDTAPTARA